MTNYRIGPHAKAKLVEIYRYTFENFGEAQADKYVKGMYSKFGDIVAGKVHARPIPPEYAASGFFLRYEKHFIYWRNRKDGGVSILAILHVSQMQGDRLKAAFGMG